MIKANELRKGSKILMGGEVQTVEAILWDDYISCIPFDAERTVDQFDPIPLTPEILEKAGFECITWFKSGETKFYEKLEITRLVPHNQYKSYGIAVFADESYFAELRDNLLVSAGFKYLHQFQNLYFALTGEELEINL